MDTLRILALSLLAGFASAGFIWYIWGVVENLYTMKRLKIASLVLDADVADETENEPEQL